MDEIAFSEWLRSFQVEVTDLPLGVATFPITGRGTIALRPISVRLSLSFGLLTIVLHITY